jgi:hypothetical protein
MYIALAISSANMRASWPLLQYNTSSRPVGKDAYPLKITPVFALAFAVAPNKNASPLKSVGKSSMSSMVLIDTMKCLLLITSLKINKFREGTFPSTLWAKV